MESEDAHYLTREMSNLMPYLVLMTYSIMKDVVSMTILRKKNKFFEAFLGMLLSILAFILVGIVIMPFAIFRICLHLALKIIYRKSYAGLLGGSDMVYEINQENTVVNVMVMYSCADKKLKDIQTLQAFVEKVQNSHDKFSCVIKKFWGYLYLIKAQVKSSDILEIKHCNTPYITPDMLYDYMEQHCLSIKTNHTWRITAFAQPIRWDDDKSQESQQFAVILTVRHCIGDGPSLAGVFKKCLTEDCKETHLNENRVSIPKRPLLTLSNARACRNPLLTKVEGRALKIPRYSNWHLVTYSERKPKYMSLIKAIKQKLQVGFVDVIGAAIYSSINDYIIQRKVKMGTFTTSSSVRIYDEELREIVNKTYNLNKLVNTTSLEGFNISCEEAGRSIKDRILFMHSVSEKMRNSTDYLFYHIFLRDICSHFPINIVRFLCNSLTGGSMVSISNLVGFNKSKYGDFSIDNIFFCVPDVTGFLFCIFSYAGRLGISVTSGKGYVRNREELRSILGNVFKYLDEAESILEI